ncbi:MBL fold metallo-hydrolase [Trujillonella endophytica]|uniref:Glyoxylase, beta-lactamase superfamily II n=1 Tax=Trujillonella endophytica TaxID=673521 RepID=A0A1H8Q3J8_9ACTN|nr:MBL fold metallo-hydrolase [Trujillella endophytica]SEO48343.1 Glyoxylase, beta-lactamase superfamily II [Trujillella endophytica]
MRVGDIRVDAVSDGTFVARPGYFGAGPGERPELFDRDGAAWLPIGCFVVRTADRVVLVDAGLGPEAQELPGGMLLAGGQLPTGLRALGVAPDEVTDVVCTHLHADHVGWLFDLDGAPVFAQATVWFGEGDRQHFVEGPGEMAAHVRAGFRAPAGSPRLRPLAADATVTPGVTAVLTPGHTPGSLCVAVASGGDRLLLLGDTVTCPVQHAEPGWRSFSDVDPALAARTRQRLWRELADGRTTGVGAHFPLLAPGRVTGTPAPRWQQLP